MGEEGVERMQPLNDLPESLAARQFFADRLEKHFRAHPMEWIGILELQVIGGPSWRSRIACDLRKKRGLNVPWNHSNLHSAYRWMPHEVLGRDASIPAPTRWPIAGAPFAEAETWTLTPPESR